MRRLVVVGTGTGVGKTYVGAELVRSWRRRGHAAWGLKPIESGVALGAEGSDAEVLRAGGPPHPGGLHHRALPDPLSPHLAAARAGHALSVAETVAWVEQAEAHLSALHDTAPLAMSLIETAGGALTPLSVSATCADLARSLKPSPLLLVAPDALGVLHDVTAALLGLHAVGCAVDFVLLSGARARDDSTGTNAGELERVVFPRLGSVAPRHRRVFVVPSGSAEVGPVLDAWSSLPL